MDTRKTFPGISASAWEHPADKATLAAFAALPGGAEILRRLVGSTTERSLRLEALANGARVGPGQYARIHALLLEACRVLDLPERPELYIRHAAEPGAFTLGVDRPFLVLTSAAIELWDEDELLSVLGHELGHVLSGHALYKTALRLLLGLANNLAGSNLLGFAAVQAATAALREWDRKSELSADRAGLLASQDSMASYRALMKTAGGRSVGEMDLNEFFRQARDYDAASEGLDSLYKLLGLLGESHPFPVARMIALQEWERGGSYEAILRGDYPRRGAEERPDPERLFREAKASYEDEFASSRDPLSQAAGAFIKAVDEAASRIPNVFGGQNPFGPEGPFGGSGPFGPGGPFGAAPGSGGGAGEGGSGASGAAGRTGDGRQPSMEEVFDEIFGPRRKG